ncbi:kelch-like protein 9 isoform X2 [Mercenaria mercenaria]|uniref:kelch-like protein 9 isoform X2 n=1 Tax=Mercenaria mercenaria TaxID=6596 RepID=UPI00234E5727|nr:kelch-like protein 9 isoform X2 [Mercenaria mercenaria]
MPETNEENEVWACKCGDGRKVKLCAQKLVEYSGYFCALMHSQMRETREKTLDLRLFTSDTIKLLIKMFRYKDNKLCDNEIEDIFKESLELEIVEDVLKAADYLDMPCIYPRCCDLLIILLPPFCEEIDRLWKMWTICQTYGLESVEEAMNKQIALNIKAIESTDYFFLREVPADVLAGVLAVPNIDISSEVGVMKLISEWILYAKEERLKWFDNLFNCIHIPSLIHSDLTEIDNIVKELGLTDVDVWKTFSNYVSNPHRFFILRQDLSQIRNGREVLMMFGGVYAQSLLPHNQQIGNQSERRLRYVPIMYQDLDEVCRQCLDSRVEQYVKRPASNISPRSRNLPSVDGGLVFKTMNRLKSPVRLIEFCICLYENFVYIAGGQRSHNEDAKFAVMGAYRMDPHIGEWGEIAHMKEARCLFTLGSVWGRLYAVGGANQFGILRCTEYYIPEEDKWYEGPQLHTQLHEHACCIFREKMYISGGHDDAEHTNRVWVLESKVGTWKPVAPLLQPRSYHAMVAMDDKMYVIGGCRKVGSEIRDLHLVLQGQGHRQECRGI